MSKRVLVTGGAGFIAHHVVEKLLNDVANIDLFDSEHIQTEDAIITFLFQLNILKQVNHTTLAGFG